MSRDLGYTPPPINIIKNNYPKKHDYRLKLRIYNHFRSKNAYVKLNLKILSRRGLPGVLGSRGQTRMGQSRPTQVWRYYTPIERKFNSDQYSHQKHGLENNSSEDIRPQPMSGDKAEKDACLSNQLHNDPSTICCYVQINI